MGLEPIRQFRGVKIVGRLSQQLVRGYVEEVHEALVPQQIASFSVLDLNGGRHVVHQARQQCLVFAQFVLRRFEFGYVGDRSHVAHGFSVLPDLAGGLPEKPSHRPVGPLETIFGHEGALFLDRGAPFGDHPVAVVGMQGLGPTGLRGGPHGGRRAHPGDLAPFLVDVEGISLRVGVVHADRRNPRKGSKSFLALAQGGFRRFLIELQVPLLEAAIEDGENLVVVERLS